MYYGDFIDLIDEEKLQKHRTSQNTSGLRIVYGVAASLVAKGDVLVTLIWLVGKYNALP